VKQINTKQSREHSSPPPRGQGAGFGILLTLLISSAAALTSYWTWQQSNIRDEIQDELEGGVTQLLQSIEHQRDTVNQRFAAQKSHQHALLQQRILALENKFSQVEQPLRADRWSVAEAIYLINIAEHHYRLEGNRMMALAALVRARKQLLEQQSPELTPALEQLSRAITQLEGDDIAGYEQQLAQLSRLSTRILELPVARHNFVIQSEAPVVEYSLKSVEGWRQFGSALWSDLQQLFRISRPGDSTNVEEQPVTADIYPILRQQLALKVEFARLALLSHSPLYLDTLKEIVALLNRYFDRESEAVQGEVSLLEQMVAAEKLEPQQINFSAIRQQLTAIGQQ